MIKFTDKRLYVKGTCQAIASDPVTGQIYYFSNKFQTGNFQTSLTLGEIRAGLGNPIAAIIPSDSAVQVEFTAADFSLWAKMAQVGGSLNYNAPAMVCQTVTATGNSLTIDVSDATPIAQLGYSKVICYVQTVGAESPIATGGVPYDLNPSTGAISGFAAVTGTKYKVWYFVNKASAQVGTLKAMFDPRVVHFTVQIPVYANDVSTAQNEGTRVGWLYAIVPRLKLGGTATLTGDQTNNDTTSMSGQAVAFDDDVISEGCTDCDMPDLAYYVYVPDDEAQDIAGLAVIGGVVSVKTGETVQIPIKFVMANGELVTPSSYALCSYELASPPSGTTASDSGLVTAGSTAGDTDFTVSYPASGSAEYTYTGTLSVSGT